MPISTQAPVIVWFRQDLRLSDNPALQAALARGQPVVPVYILDRAHVFTGASLWWLHGSLEALGLSLERAGAPLILREGDSSIVLERLIEETGAQAVYWNRCYEPAAIARDKTIKAMLRARGLEVESFNGALLAEPWTVRTGAGGPYKVFTPFWRALSAMSPFARPLPAPGNIRGLSSVTPHGPDALRQLKLRSVAPDWAAGLRAEWIPGEAGAHARLEAFLSGVVTPYATARDIPGRVTTSRLSPHLHWGEISPRQIWMAADVHRDAEPGDGEGVTAFLREIGWREFSAHLLFHWPEMAVAAWKPAFNHFPWLNDEASLRAWQRGLTGYPIVDAGMRELWQTGFMHNRVRMIVASFLVKDLLIDWRRGAEWFEDTLVDADLASNRASWQWVAGSGADASPWFRIFNPVTQGQKFDPDGAYIRRFVPELSALDNSYIHRPWEAPPVLLKAAEIMLGKTYPLPLVDHAAARERALSALSVVGGSQG